VGTPGHRYTGVWTDDRNLAEKFEAGTVRTYAGVGGSLGVSDPVFSNQACFDDTDLTNDGVDHFYDRYGVGGYYYGTFGRLTFATIEGLDTTRAPQPPSGGVWEVLLAWDDDNSDGLQELYGVPGVEVRPGNTINVRIERSIKTRNLWFTHIRYNGKWGLVQKKSGWHFDLAQDVETAFETYNGCSRKDILPTSNSAILPNFGTKDPASVSAVRVLNAPNRYSRDWLQIANPWTPANFPSAAANPPGPTRTNSRYPCIGSSSTYCYEVRWTANWHGASLTRPMKRFLIAQRFAVGTVLRSRKVILLALLMSLNACAGEPQRGFLQEPGTAGREDESSDLPFCSPEPRAQQESTPEEPPNLVPDDPPPGSCQWRTVRGSPRVAPKPEDWFERPSDQDQPGYQEPSEQPQPSDSP
jgi:hypothetical protein